MSWNVPFRRLAPPLMVAGSTFAFLPSSSNSQATTTKTEEKACTDTSKLLFVGTGSSTGCPKPLCSMLFGPKLDPSSIKANNPELQQLRQDYQSRCHTSAVASLGDPKQNKNYRNNPALLISHNGKNIIIDAGKTFREAALRWFPEHAVASLDAIILTHHHMDAAGGLDDVRGFQRMAVRGTFNKAPQMVPMPLHLSEFCLSDVSQRFPWLFPKQQPSYTSGLSDKPAVERHVASFDIQVFQDFQPMNVAGLKIIPLPVWHGDDLISYGFAFTLNGTNVIYISDISKMIPETMEYIQSKLPLTDLLIVDALLPDKPHSVHFSLEQAMDLAKGLKAKQTYLVGMNCDAFPLHEVQNELLHKQTGGTVQLAYDGQVLTL